MPVGLRATGILSYNGIVFDGASKISVKSEKVRDEANFTVIYHRYVITVSCVIAPTTGQSSTDNDMFFARSRLSEDGKALVFVNKGFGNDLCVGPGQRIQDIRMGPKPQVLTWEPIGNNRACQVVWSVEVCVPECENAFIRRDGVSAANYELDYQIDEHGDTTRAISGYIETVQIRNGRKIIESADKYRDLARFRAPLGFKRVHQHFTVSKDKSRLDFTIVDQQIPSTNPYAKSVTAIGGTHGVNAALASTGFYSHRNAMEMSISLNRDVAGSVAWQIFTGYVRQRVREAIQQGKDVFLEEVSALEDLFGRTHRFQCVWRMMGELKDIIGHNGLWKPLTGAAWDKWRDSIRKEQSQRGTAGLFHNPQLDSIVDLCSSYPTVLVPEEHRPEPPKYEKPELLKNYVPSPNKSYLKYEHRVIPYRTNPVIRQSTLQAPESDSPSMSNPMSTTFNYGQRTGTPDVIQQRGKGRYSIRYKGSAIRVGHQIGRPGLLTFAGFSGLTEVGSFFDITTLGVFLTVPVYAAVWDIAYMLPGSPGALTFPTRTPADV